MDVNRLGINGEGIGYVERQVVFVDGALPGEKVAARITQVEPNFARAKLLRIIKKAKQRINPPCPVYEQCGGCTLQHLEYQSQLEWKRELVRESFARYTGQSHWPIQPTVGMNHPWEYRNKAQLPVAVVGGEVVAGLYSPGTHKLVDVSACPIQHPTTNEIVRTVRDLLQELGIPIYNEKKHTGSVRTIVPRIGFETGEVQLTLVTRTEELPRKKELIQRLRERLPYLTSIMQNINPARTSLVFGEKTVPLWGKEKIEERLGEVRFTLSSRAFFQLNPEQTTKLYNLVAEAAALTGEETVVDAYCGVGTIGLWLAPKAKEVLGIDVIPEAIADARENAVRSGIRNARFEVGKVERLLVERVKKGFRPDVVVVDPPRTGCDEELLRAMLTAKPKRIVYVSCNPSTLAKDCNILLEKYEIQNIQPVDMFPQTAHVECVTLLTLK
ncbi:23S rRNA (uracil-5-)-methyltransferase RumA [Effusibacillus lacus]|uniref:23S rRNA (Uracil-5-)-methyltransferase RumA n=2 Tax=Effusibacillus lacus TaxID=1348429 RepID=A0A292YMV1_9BACL|nr:23S rRNA m(5)U-1939 methyltransferase [Effusibacillus lacus]GAX91258.1 23S rRNA (uracil-5-)-methyltransferase RumA [Effusibacillus lacus]